MNREAVIAGIGEVPCGKYPNRMPLDVAIDVSEQAIADSGLDRRDIDTILCAPCFADPWFNTDLGFARMVDELGMRESVRLNAHLSAGGATGTALLKTATAMVASGQSEAVLCLHTEKFTNLTGQEGFDFFAKAGIERSGVFAAATLGPTRTGFCLCSCCCRCEGCGCCCCCCESCCCCCCCCCESCKSCCCCESCCCCFSRTATSCCNSCCSC